MRLRAVAPAQNHSVKKSWHENSFTFKFQTSPQDKDNHTFTDMDVSKGQNIYKYSTENLPPHVMVLHSSI